MIGSSTHKDEALDRLTSGIAQLTTSDAWRAWLACRPLPRYSFGNPVLILVQQPAATRVAGFGAWRRLGRAVRRGERAIWILAPMTRRVVADDIAEAPERASRVVTAFRPVPVFDQAQTDGDPLPQVCTRPTGDEPSGAYAGLVQITATIGFAVEDHAFGDDTNGDCTHALRRIRVRLALAPAHRVKTRVTSWRTRCCTWT